MEKEDREVQQIVKRLAKFLGLEVVRKSVFGFKRHLVIRDRHWKNTVKILGYPANCLSWNDALCKFLGAPCFQVSTKPERNRLETEVFLVDNPFFDMSPEVACLHLDLLAPEKEER